MKKREREREQSYLSWWRKMYSRYVSYHWTLFVLTVNTFSVQFQQVFQHGKIASINHNFFRKDKEVQKEIRKRENIKKKHICLQSRKIKGNISERRVKNIFYSPRESTQTHPNGELWWSFVCFTQCVFQFQYFLSYRNIFVIIKISKYVKPFCSHETGHRFLSFFTFHLFCFSQK